MSYPNCATYIINFGKTILSIYSSSVVYVVEINHLSHSIASFYYFDNSSSVLPPPPPPPGIIASFRIVVIIHSMRHLYSVLILNNNLFLMDKMDKNT